MSNNNTWAGFLKKLKNLKEGQSFMLKNRNLTNHRMALAIAPYWLGKRFSAKKVKDGYRISCVETVKK